MHCATAPREAVGNAGFSKGHAMTGACAVKPPIKTPVPCAASLQLQWSVLT